LRRHFGTLYLTATEQHLGRLFPSIFTLLPLDFAQNGHRTSEPREKEIDDDE